VKDTSLRAAIDAEVALINAAKAPDPSGSGYERVTAGTLIKLANGVSVMICEDTGAVCGLVDADGRSWASPSRQLALFTYTLYTNDQMSAFRDEYCAPHGCNPNEFGKAGMPLNDSVTATPERVVGVWVKRNDNGLATEVLSLALMDPSLNVLYGAPTEVWTRVVSATAPSPSTVQVEVTLVNKTATRFAEAAFVTFNPPADSSASGAVRTSASNVSGTWALDKLGEWV
jgi:hypothetical protein